MKPNSLRVLLFASVIALGAFPAYADDDDDRYRRHVKAEIDDLDAEIRYDGRDWVVDVDYKVKIEGRQHLPGLALVMTVDEAGRLLTLPEGETLEVVVPMDHPTEVDDDEVEFEHGMRFTIPGGAFDRPWGLRLTGMLYASPEGPILDRKDTRIEEWRPDYGRNIHVGVSIGRHYPPPVVHHRVVERRVYYPAPRTYEVRRHTVIRRHP